MAKKKMIRAEIALCRMLPKGSANELRDHVAELASRCSMAIATQIKNATVVNGEVYFRESDVNNTHEAFMEIFTKGVSRMNAVIQMAEYAAENLRNANRPRNQRRPKGERGR